MAQRLRKSNLRVDPTSPSEVSVSTSVIWIDAAPLLKLEQTKLKAAKRKLSVAEDRLKVHKQSDEPEYQRWFNVTFSERLGEIRALYEKLAHLDSLVWKVEREIVTTGCSAYEAYQRVLQALDEEATAKSETGTETETESPDEPSEDESFNHESHRDGDESSADQERRRESAKARPKKNQKPLDDLIKQIYRALVRKLHPDLNPDLSEELKDRWFDVQDAYEDRDLARLESLLALCEDGDNTSDESFIDKIQSLSRLRLLLKSVAKKLKTSQRQLSQLKRAPAWEFHKVRKDSRKLSYLERDVKFELRNAEETLESDIRTLESQIDQCLGRPETDLAQGIAATGIFHLSFRATMRSGVMRSRG